MTQIVWFKKDLRLADHAPFCAAVEKGPVLPLLIVEPTLWKRPDLSRRQYGFYLECILELKSSLREVGLDLLVQVGDSVKIFEKIYKSLEFTDVWSHQETGNGWTYDRDKKVKKFFNSHRIGWHETQSGGVIRRLKCRDTWAQRWKSVMSSNVAIYNAAKIKSAGIFKSDLMPNASDLFDEGDCINRQVGGRTEGLKLLNSFFGSRGKFYSSKMSSPLTAEESCSRISPYLAFGVVSIKEVYQKAQKAYLDAKNSGAHQWQKSIYSYIKRLYWHCHFIQKLESQPDIEFKNLHQFSGKSASLPFNHSYFDAWQKGVTGFPFIDACMRSLRSTGWINFRMRAMLVSFATHYLELNWRYVALYLATQFVDYEPGIHYSQCQMQAGTTGINAIRIYCPIKQSIDQDPEGTFIRKWVPELSELDKVSIHKPWEFPLFSTQYPDRIIDEKTQRKKACDRLYKNRRSPEFKSESKKIYKKHGSRKSRT